MKKKVKYAMLLGLTLLFFVPFSTTTSFSQTKTIDSLNGILSVAKEDTNRLNTLTALSIRLLALGNWDSGLIVSKQALALAEKFNSKKAKAFAYKNIGYCLINKSNSDGVGYLYSGLKLMEEIGDRYQVAALYQGIASTFTDHGNFEEALKNLEAALKVRKEIGDSTGISQSYNSIGENYRRQGKYSEALQKHFAALTICKSPGFTGALWSLPYCYQCIAQAYQAQADSIVKHDRIKAAIKYNDALTYYKPALKLWIDINRSDGESETYINIGEVYFHLRNLVSAREFYERGLTLSIRAQLPDFTRQGYLHLSRLDSTEGKFEQAYNHFKMYILYRDSLINEETFRKLEGNKLQYEFDKKEDSLKQKQVLTQTKLDSQKKQKNYYLGGAVLLALLSVFVFLNFRNQKKINRLMDDAHAKEKAELELQSLRAQLNPHFMFNSLNAIQELILLEENEKSQSYLARFAKLLRLLLENADKPFIPLQREIDFLQLYLSLENLRIPDLQFSITVDSNINTEETQIPNMILQPYIENAIWHGLSHKQSDKKLQIRVNGETGFTKYEIEDNGVGRKRSSELKSLYRKEHKSKGMELLSKRFRLLAKEYGSDIETEITDVINDSNISGTRVTIKVPVELARTKVK